MFCAGVTQKTRGLLPTVSGNPLFDFQFQHFLTIGTSIRWEAGGWTGGLGTVQRGASPGWQFSDGFLFFGGWDPDNEVDKTDVIHLGNDFSNKGEITVKT